MCTPGHSWECGGVPNPEPLKEIVQSLFIFLPVAEFGLWHETENPGMPIARHTVGGVACSSASTSPDACVCGGGARVVESAGDGGIVHTSFFTKLLPTVASCGYNVAGLFLVLENGGIYIAAARFVVG